MRSLRFALLLAIGAVCITVGGTLFVDSALAQATAITGVVVDRDSRPIPDAIVRIQTTLHQAVTDEAGAFRLRVPGSGPYNLTACAVGFYCGGPVAAHAGDSAVVIALEAHSAMDNPEYDWRPSTDRSGSGEDQGCAACHSAAGADLPYTLPVDEWLLDAHAGAARNPRFLTMYSGTDVDGNRSAPTQYAYRKDYGRFPLARDPAIPYYGPGYMLDFSDAAGNCATCHTPMAVLDAPYGVDPTQVSGVASEGIGCDFCHKVWDVVLNPITGLPYDNRPGVLSIEFRRPAEGHQFFAGPFDDVAPGEDTYSPLQTESAFCAPCHSGVFWDTPIYDSFGEWLASPYSDTDSGQTCQDCHMPRLGAPTFALPDRGGLERDPRTIFSHRMPGALDSELLASTVELKMEAERTGDTVQVQVSITNTGAGHHVPTDSPLRQMLLTVTAVEVDGRVLPLVSGPQLPGWTGDMAGQPGLYFAKVLQELWTEHYPSGAYWVPTRIFEDTRLPALATAQSDFTFSAPQDAPVYIETRVVLRRAFYDLMRQKGWDVPDIEMERVTATVH